MTKSGHSTFRFVPPRELIGRIGRTFCQIPLKRHPDLPWLLGVIQKATSGDVW
jgi:hypothetical protein